MVINFILDNAHKLGQDAAKGDALAKEIIRLFQLHLSGGNTQGNYTKLGQCINEYKNRG